MKNRGVRLLLLSDIHAFRHPTGLPTAPSRFGVTDLNKVTEITPAAALLTLVKKEKIVADFIVCCGDLGDRADPVGIEGAWHFLNVLKGATESQRVITTVGNHDVDSRFLENTYNPVEFLKELKPKFPVGGTQFKSFWTDHYYVVKDDHIRFLVINTAANHGYKDEADHGRIGARSLGCIRRELKRPCAAPLNICVLHHHPHRHSEISLGDYDDIRGGQQLLDLLSLPDGPQWLVIHGHKHHPRITYGQGNSRSAIVFSAGSFSAHLHSDLREVTSNQFYILQFDQGELAKMDTLVGQFESWAWYDGTGWVKSGSAGGLPARGGFGYRDLCSLAARIAKAGPKRIQPWSSIELGFSELQYITPADFGHLTYMLKRRGCSVVLDGDGTPVQMVRGGTT